VQANRQPGSRQEDIAGRVVRLANAERRVVMLSRLTENDKWARALLEPMSVMGYVHLLASHQIDPKAARIGLVDALALARKTGESWFIRMPESWPEPAPEEPSPGDLDRLMLHPRAATEWLLRMPMRRRWVPLTLRAYLEATKQSGESSKGADVVYRTGLAGRPTSRDLCEAEMRRRAGSGELLTTLSAECKYLVEWLTKTHPEAPLIKAKLLGNGLRDVHAELKKDLKL